MAVYVEGTFRVLEPSSFLHTFPLPVAPQHLAVTFREVTGHDDRPGFRSWCCVFLAVSLARLLDFSDFLPSNGETEVQQRLLLLLLTGLVGGEEQLGPTL